MKLLYEKAETPKYVLPTITKFMKILANRKGCHPVASNNAFISIALTPFSRSLQGIYSVEDK